MADAIQVHTVDGGLAIKLINKTGAPSVKGTVVIASTTTDGAFELAPSSSQYPIGIVYEAGIADGSDCLVVVAGIAEVLINDSQAATHGDWARVSTTVNGRARCTGFEAGNHDLEIGHCIQSVGAGTNQLAKVVLHFR